MLQTAMYSSKKYPYPSTPKGIGNSMGVGFGWGPQRIKNLKESTKLNWNFLGGGGGERRRSWREFPPRGMDIVFLELHIDLISTGS